MDIDQVLKQHSSLKLHGIWIISQPTLFSISLSSKFFIEELRDFSPLLLQGKKGGTRYFYTCCRDIQDVLNHLLLYTDISVSRALSKLFRRRRGWCTAALSRWRTITRNNIFKEELMMVTCAPSRIHQIGLEYSRISFEQPTW